METETGRLSVTTAIDPQAGGRRSGIPRTEARRLGTNGVGPYGRTETCQGC